MGWSHGSAVFSDIISALKEHIEDDELRVLVYFDLISAFENADCDNLNECLGEDPSFDEAYYELNPSDPDEE